MNLPLATLLVAHGADVTHKDNYGKTALFYAKKYKRHDVEDFLRPVMKRQMSAKVYAIYEGLIVYDVCWLIAEHLI